MVPSKIQLYRALVPKIYRKILHQLNGSANEKGNGPLGEVGLVKIVSSFKEGINVESRKTNTVMPEKIMKINGSKVILSLLLDAILILSVYKPGNFNRKQ